MAGQVPGLGHFHPGPRQARGRCRIPRLIARAARRLFRLSRRGQGRGRFPLSHRHRRSPRPRIGFRTARSHGQDRPGRGHRCPDPRAGRRRQGDPGVRRPRPFPEVRLRRDPRAGLCRRPAHRAFGLADGRHQGYAVPRRIRSFRREIRRGGRRLIGRRLRRPVRCRRPGPQGSDQRQDIERGPRGRRQERRRRARPRPAYSGDPRRSLRTRRGRFPDDPEGRRGPGVLGDFHQPRDQGLRPDGLARRRASRLEGRRHLLPRAGHGLLWRPPRGPRAHRHGQRRIRRRRPRRGARFCPADPVGLRAAVAVPGGTRRIRPGQAARPLHDQGPDALAPQQDRGPRRAPARRRRRQDQPGTQGPARPRG